MALLTAERLFWHCGAHTAKPKIGLIGPIPPIPHHHQQQQTKVSKLSCRRRWAGGRGRGGGDTLQQSNRDPGTSNQLPPTLPKRLLTAFFSDPQCFVGGRNQRASRKLCWDPSASASRKLVLGSRLLQGGRGTHTMPGFRNDTILKKTSWCLRLESGRVLRCIYRGRIFLEKGCSSFEATPRSMDRSAISSPT